MLYLEILLSRVLDIGVEFLTVKLVYLSMHLSPSIESVRLLKSSVTRAWRGASRGELRAVLAGDTPGGGVEACPPLPSLPFVCPGLLYPS